LAAPKEIIQSSSTGKVERLMTPPNPKLYS
jgi:hypothetical protein